MRAGQRAYEGIRSRILDGNLAMGKWLREEELSDLLGVSRTPVREALRQLSVEGLVHYEANRGAQVFSWSAEDLNEIFDLRALLEPHACRLTAGKADAGVIANLRQILAELDVSLASGPADLALHSELNNRFHQQIVDAAGGPHLRAVAGSAIHLPLVLQTFRQYSPEALARSQRHHRELVDAIECHDPDWAASVMRSHVLSAKREILAAYANERETPGTDSPELTPEFPAPVPKSERQYG